MATRNKRKLAALNKENCEEHLRSNLAQNSTAPRSQEDYITQVSEEIEGRVTKKLSQEFSRTENRILGALATLDDFLMNPLLQGHSAITPDTSRNVLSINQGTNEDDSQSDHHPEAGPLTSGREERRGISLPASYAKYYVIQNEFNNQSDLRVQSQRRLFCFRFFVFSSSIFLFQMLLF